jgi:hypothetical protein
MKYYLILIKFQNLGAVGKKTGLIPVEILRQLAFRCNQDFLPDG